MDVSALGQWVLSGINTPLGGVVIGAVAALGGGLGGAVLLAWLEDRRETSRSLVAHKGAVRAVVYELNTNRTSLQLMQQQGSLRSMFIYDRAYHLALFDLVSALPGGLATDIAQAYAVTAALRDTREFGLVKQALEATDKAQSGLMSYALDQGLHFADPLAPVLVDEDKLGDVL